MSDMGSNNSNNQGGGGADSPSGNASSDAENVGQPEDEEESEWATDQGDEDEDFDDDDNSDSSVNSDLDPDVQQRRREQRRRDEEQQFYFAKSGGCGADGASPALSMFQQAPEWDHWKRTGSVKSAEDNGETFAGIMGHVTFVRKGRVYIFGGLNKEIGQRWLANVANNQWVRDPAQGRAVFASAALPLTPDSLWEREDDGTEYLYIPSTEPHHHHHRAQPPTAGGGPATAPAPVPHPSHNSNPVNADDSSESSFGSALSEADVAATSLAARPPLSPGMMQLLQALLGTPTEDTVMLSSLADALGFDATKAEAYWQDPNCPERGENANPYHSIGLKEFPVRMPHPALGPAQRREPLSRPPHVEGHVGFYHAERDVFEFHSGAYCQQPLQLWQKLNRWYELGGYAPGGTGLRGRYHFQTKEWSIVKGGLWIPYCPSGALHEASGMTFLYGGNTQRNSDQTPGPFSVCKWEPNVQDSKSNGPRIIPEKTGKYLHTLVQFIGDPPAGIMKGCAACVEDYLYLWGGYGKSCKTDPDRDFLGTQLKVCHIGDVVRSFASRSVPNPEDYIPRAEQVRLTDGSVLPVAVWRTIDLTLMGTAPMRYPLRRSRPTMIPMPSHNGLVVFGGMYEQDYRCDDLLFIDLASFTSRRRVDANGNTKFSKDDQERRQRCFIYPLDGVWRNELKAKENEDVAKAREGHRSNASLMDEEEEDNQIKYLEDAAVTGVDGDAVPTDIPGETKEVDVAPIKKYSNAGCPSIFRDLYPPEMSSTSIVCLGPEYGNAIAVLGGGAGNQRVGDPDCRAYTSALAPPKLARVVAQFLARQKE